MRKYIIRGIPFLVIVVVSIQFYGCDESSVTPGSKITVNGKAVNLWGEPVSGIKVFIIGNADTITTASDGVFTFSDVSAPYDLVIQELPISDYRLLSQLSSEEIYYYITEQSSPATNTCQLTVSFSSPNLQNSNQKKFIFTDGEKINSYSINGNSWTVRLRDKNSVNGKLIYLGYRSQNNKVTSYESFGVKDINLSTNGNFSVVFDSTEISHNPDEDTISGYATNYIGGNINNYFTLWFGESHTANYASEIIFETITSQPNFNFIIPANLPIPFTTVIYSMSGSHSIKNNYQPGSQSAVLKYEPVLEVVEPSNGANITLSSVFSVINEGRSGIYIFTIIDDNKKFFVYSSSSTVAMSEFVKAGFNLVSGEEYTWLAAKIGEYESLNEYAVNPGSLQTFSSGSEVRTFTVAP